MTGSSYDRQAFVSLGTCVRQVVDASPIDTSSMTVASPVARDPQCHTKLSLLIPHELQLSVLLCTICQVQVYQALIRETYFGSLMLEICNRSLVYPNGNLSLQFLSIWVWL